MSIVLTSTNFATMLSKDLKKASTRTDSPMALHQAQTVVARAFGYAHWHEMQRSCDEHAKPAEKGTRFHGRIVLGLRRALYEAGRGREAEFLIEQTVPEAWIAEAVAALQKAA